MEYKDGWPEKIHLVQAPEWLRRVGRFLGGIVTIHQLASHGDHLFENRGGGPMLDRELERTRTVPDIQGLDL